MTDPPRVTLGVMTFNNERYLAGALDAVLAQDFTDFEVVICDNQSTDSTWEICQRYAAKDERIRIHRNPTNVGFSGNFNRVVSLARGEYFRLTSHDDLIAPALLSRCVEVLDAEPRAVLAYPHSMIIDDDGTQVCPWEDVGELRDPRPGRRLARLVQRYCLVNELFGLIRTEALRRTRGFSPFASTDVRLLFELAVRGEFRVVPEPLFFRRIHSATSFVGEEHPPGQLYDWLEPELARQGQVPARMDKPGGDTARLTRETLRALLASEFPPPQRLRLAAGFVVVRHLRLGRIVLGRWRRRLMRVPPEPPPWEVEAASPSPSG